MKCNDSIYGKVLQLLTLAVYVTQDLQAAVAGMWCMLFLLWRSGWCVCIYAV